MPEANPIRINRTIPAALTESYRSNGWWTDDTIGNLLAQGLRNAPDADFRVYSDVRPWTGTFATVEGVARRLAQGLRDRGVGPGDVVAFQLPNWMEAAATFWASSFLGAVVVPVVHFYGAKEIRHIIATAKPKVFITFERFGRAGYQAELYADVPIVGVVGRGFDELLAEEPLAGDASVDASAPAVIAFTSGTTRNAKGVVHSHQTLGFETLQLAAAYPPGLERQLTAAPVGHFIGMLNAFLIPVVNGTPIYLTDAWDPAQTLSLMLRDGLTFGGGAPYFVISLLDHPDFTPAHLDNMRYAGMGGSAVPAATARRLHDHGVTVWRSYGSTEHPSIVSTHYTVPAEKRLFTDGRPLPGVEVRLTDDGEILSRGPDLCLGYLDADLTSAAFDDEGWYHTGDIGVLDDDGYLSITDRKSDIIIRGGENISAMEVEEVLQTLPGVAEAVAVAAPDDRFGERTAAVLRMKPELALPSMDELRAHFARSGLAKQKWPEEIHQVDDFPRTPSSKIQKVLVRKMVAEARG
ncbi:AMP-dependent synthetase [Mycolicibacterium peregrinum]|uniref:AMP-dependent synthetase n=1 Tax=Mycolicibacterium peregrinum TaxID=43304 RepID=A0A1A0RGQ7_MYCPR|nr:AMP-binding protein [Mycolicibacterium peregrinum]OBB33715.1 AMP-dependent synthetase [Mycolicibacterium peregrinum]